MLFTKTGSPGAKEPVNDFRHELSVVHIVYIDTLFLRPDYHGKVINLRAMEMLHGLIPQLPSLGPSAPRPIGGATLLLSPAASSDHPIDNGYDVVQIENKLIARYERCGYVVWVRGDEHVVDSRTVIGCTV